MNRALVLLFLVFSLRVHLQAADPPPEPAAIVPSQYVTATAVVFLPSDAVAAPSRDDVAAFIRTLSTRNGDLYGQLAEPMAQMVLNEERFVMVPMRRSDFPVPESSVHDWRTRFGEDGIARYEASRGAIVFRGVDRMPGFLGLRTVHEVAIWYAGLENGVIYNPATLRLDLPETYGRRWTIADRLRAAEHLAFWEMPGEGDRVDFHAAGLLQFGLPDLVLQDLRPQSTKHGRVLICATVQRMLRLSVPKPGGDSRSPKPAPLPAEFAVSRDDLATAMDINDGSADRSTVRVRIRLEKRTGTRKPPVILLQAPDGVAADTDSWVRDAAERLAGADFARIP